MAASIILPDLRLTSRANQVWDNSGIDSFESCLDPKHFLQYPHSVEYRFNSRGFRDSEWPQELSDAIWCVGDSFTVGLGQPFEHIWPQVLSKKTNRRTINVSMDGASNDWIARRALEIINAVDPCCIVIMWSYVERRERFQAQLVDDKWREIYQQIKAPDWPDCASASRALHLPDHIQREIAEVHHIQLPVVFDELMSYQVITDNDQEHFTNWQSCVDRLVSYETVIHSVIPRFVSDHDTNSIFWRYLIENTVKHTDRLQQIDWARDGHHFDILTARAFVHQLLPLID